MTCSASAIFVNIELNGDKKENPLFELFPNVGNNPMASTLLKSTKFTANSKTQLKAFLAYSKAAGWTVYLWERFLASRTLPML